MKERIIQFLKAENKTSAQLADDIGVQASGISHILSGRNNPSLDFVIKMLEKYKFISPEWLLFGRGDMYRDQAMRELFSVDALNEKILETNVDSLSSAKNSDPQPAIKQLFSNEEGNGAPQPAKKTEGDKETLERVVLLYSDMSFRVYTPGK